MLAILLTCLCSASALRLNVDEKPKPSQELADTLPKGLGKDALGHCTKQPTVQTECGANDRFSFAEMQALLPEFQKVWDKRPGTKKQNKLGANHQFAEWFLVKALKPTAIIESGVWMGGATWGLREAAGPSTPIFSFDPQDKVSGGKGFRDPNPNAKYFLAQDWKDVTEADWDSLIPRKERASALVILDDHQIFFDRFKALKELGFGHIFVEDNNKYGWGNTSPNFFCTKAELHKQGYAHWNIKDCLYNSPWGNVTQAKEAGVHAAKPLQSRILTWEDHEKNSKWVQENMKTYFEFPAIFDVCQRSPSLLKDSAELANLHFSSDTKDGYLYDHRYPPYIQVKLD